MAKKNGHGGKRKGAGRPKGSKNKSSITLSRTNTKGKSGITIQRTKG
jgi:hypothetical protein